MARVSPKGDSFVFTPGAGGMAWYWHRVVEALEAQKALEAIAVELPADDEQAGLRDYVRVVVRAVRGRHNAILVAHSLAISVRHSCPSKRRFARSSSSTQ